VVGGAPGSPGRADTGEQNHIEQPPQLRSIDVGQLRADGRPHGDVEIERHLLLRKATEFKPATEDITPFSPPLRSMERNATGLTQRH